MTTSDTAACFHCTEPLAGSQLTVRIADRDEHVCCAGCRAVAELIATAGLQDYYRYRDAPPMRPDAAALDDDAWAVYSRPEVSAQFTSKVGDTESVTLLVDGLRCAACSWLIDRGLKNHVGLRSISVNTATGRAYLEWDARQTNLGAVMRAIARLGYRPQPVTDITVARTQQDERRSALKRLAVAAFGMMQVMMFAVATYSADLAAEVMDAGLLNFFRLVSLLVATPVMFYAGRPILINAWNSLRARSIGMDVPVGIALVLAFAASVWNTFRGAGEVYFDSVTMFIFFLTLGRFIEMTVRHRTASVTDALARQLPATAHRVRNGEVEDVLTAALAPHDTVLVRCGEIVPADGVIAEGETSIDEALLTGESLPVQRGLGERVAAGTLNAKAAIQIEVTAVGKATVLSGIVALLRRAQAKKPAVAQAADRAAAVFLRYVLIAAALVCSAWLAVDPSRAFEATLAVLVVACPCAFAIAMPAALAAATGQLARHGVLVVRHDAIEALTKIQHVIFDKTGTLTRGEVRLEKCTPVGALSESECLSIAAALEQASEHPIARAFQGVPTHGLVAHDAETVPGRGVEGVVNGHRYRIGATQFVTGLHNDAEASGTKHTEAGTFALGDEHAVLAVFEVADALRPDSHSAVAELHGMQIATEILSGDAHAAVADIARRCSITQFFARCSPARKLARVQELHAQGERVAMLGDGINDAPVLGAADVSIAMGRGAALAISTADLVLVGERLLALPAAIRIARQTLRIARQNLFWSAAYNFCALPLAALGLVPPWLAAAGMSASSVAVVLNAMRLLPGPRATQGRVVAEHKAASVSSQSPRFPVYETQPSTEGAAQS